MKLARKLLIAGLLFLLVLSFTPGPALRAQGTGSQKRVLFINSYHPGYKWSDDILRGIESVLGPGGENVDLRVEYMDTKRTTNESYLLALRDTYRIKYFDAKLDLILVSDDAGLNFLLQYADVMFWNTPIVFCGANYFDTRRLADQRWFTGVSEEADLKGTMDLMLKLHPNTRQVVAVIDTTVTGRQIHQGLVQIIPDYPQVQFTLLEDVTMDEVRQHVSALTPGSLVLVTNFFRDKANVLFEYNDFSSLIAQSSAVPVYAGWDYSLGFGVVGGKMISGFTEGQRAARIGQRILNGEKLSTIPVVKQVESQYMFDYKQLERWGINPSSLPPDSTVINRPFSFYETYKTLIWVAGVAFVVQAAVAIALSLNVLRRRQAEAKLSESNRELQGIRLSLEQRVEERTAALEQRAVQLQAAAEVARATTSVLEPDALLRQVVDLVRERFNLYYVGLFLLDQDKRFAVLRAGTGEAGQQMLARAHKLEVGGGSMVGQCVTRGQARIAVDVGAEAVRFDNPLLPNTRSEMALPLRSRGQVVGAMTVQSVKAAAFDEADIAIMQTMSDQVAVALDNARLFAETQVALQEMNATQRRYMAQAWNEYLRGRAVSGYEQAGEALTPLGEQVLPETQLAASQQRPVKIGDGGSGQPESQATLVAPILLRGRPIGALGLKTPEKGRQWSAEDIALAEAISEQFALAAENLRLLDETQRRAAQERLIGEVTSRIRESLDIETVLKTTASEMRQALDLDNLVIRLATPETDSASKPAQERT